MKKRLDKKKKKIGSEKITTVCSWPITAIPTYQSLSSKVSALIKLHIVFGIVALNI